MPGTPPNSPSFFQRAFIACWFLFLLSACATHKEPERPEKYRTDIEEMMPVPYTPRDDGVPLSSEELYAFKTVSDFDRELSVEDAQIVELHFKYFVHQKRDTFQRFLDRTARFLPHIRRTFTERGIPADIAYLCMVESGGNPNAKSPAGAVGLWQFMPYTGQKYGLTQNNWVDERRDPYKATYAASDYLLKLYTDFADWPLAVAAYNAGEGKVGRAVSGTGAQDFFELCRLDFQLEERARLRDETRMYVPRVIAVAKIMRNLQRLGFREPPSDAAWDLAPIPVQPGTNLAELARRLDLTWDEFSGMNPSFRRTASPPGGQSTAYVPPEKMAEAVNWMASPEARSYAEWKEYTVKKGDSLASIAKRHKVSVAALKDANGLTVLPKRGSTLLIPGKGKIEPVYDALPTAETAPAASAGTYVVKSGDSLHALARQWSTSVASIRIANRMGARDILQPGRRISIPGDSKNKPAAGRVTVRRDDNSAQATTSTYIVKAKDSIFSIAKKNGISVQALCEANNLNPKKTVIRAGQRLTIPGKKLAQSPFASKQAGQLTPGKSGDSFGKGGKSKNVTVRAGDTLYRIAKANNISVQALLKANKLGSAPQIRTGQKLLIP